MGTLSNNSGNEIFKVIFDTCIESILISDQSGEIQLVNAYCEQMFGYERGEMIGLNITDLIPEDLRKVHQSHTKGYFKHPSNRTMGSAMSLYALKKNNVRFPVEISLSHSQFNDQKVAIAFIVDITKRKDIEDAAKEEQEKIKAIIDTATDGIITIDTKGVIESVNPAIEHLFGYDASELFGKNINFLMPEPYKSNHHKYMTSFQESGIAKIIGRGREVAGQKKDGKVFPFNLSVSEVKLRNRTIYTGIVHDLSEQKEAKEKLRKLNLELEKRVSERTRELADLIIKLEDNNQKLKKADEDLRKALEKEKELNELKSRFVSMASHEFRTPLSTILSSASLVSKYSDDQKEKKEKHINRIKSSVRNLTGILNDFLSIDKLETGVIETKPTTFDLTALCSEITEEMGTMLKEGQKIEYKHTGNSVQENLDPNLMRNIILNLVSNAIKYSHEHKTIFLTTSNTDTSTLLEVQDQGIGIPEEDKAHMFERFFRAKNVTNIQGTGLGLIIVQRYADLMHGTLTFESELEVGSKFSISFKK